MCPHCSNTCQPLKAGKMIFAGVEGGKGSNVVRHQFQVGVPKYEYRQSALSASATSAGGDIIPDLCSALEDHKDGSNCEIRQRKKSKDSNEVDGWLPFVYNKQLTIALH